MKVKFKVVTIVLVLVIISLAVYSVYLHSFSKAKKVVEVQINNILSNKNYKQIKEISQDDKTNNFFTTLMELDTKEIKCELGKGYKGNVNVDRIYIEPIINSHLFQVVIEPINKNSFLGKLFPKWVIKSIVLP